MPGPLSRWTLSQFTEIAADDPGGELYSATAELASMIKFVELDTRHITEASVLSELGIDEGDAVLAKIESAVSPRVARLLKSDVGINICDAQSVALIQDLEANAVLTKPQADALLAMRMEKRPKWPGIRAADIQYARAL